MRICAAGIVVKDNKVLLGLRGKETTFYPDTWDVFGGHCEPGETLVRELGEELGIEPVRYTFLEMFKEPNPEQHGDGEYHFFVIDGWKGEPVNRGDEHQRIEWFGSNELAGICLAAQRYRVLFCDLLVC